MTLAGLAHRRRARARALLLQGDFAGALETAREAEALAATPDGAAIVRVSECLLAAAGHPTRDAGGPG